MIRQLQAAVVILTMFVVGCGASSRQKTLKTNLTTLNAARDGFVAWDEMHQTAIVEAAVTYEEGAQTLDEYHTEREPVLEGFEVAYRTLAVAAYDPSLENAMKAYSQVLEIWRLLKALTGELPAQSVPPDPH